MAETKSRAPGVSYRHNVAKGQHELGVKIAGYFVPFATLDDAVVAQRLQSAQLAAEAEPEAEEADE